MISEELYLGWKLLGPLFLNRSMTSLYFAPSDIYSNMLQNFADIWHWLIASNWRLFDLYTILMWLLRFFQHSRSAELSWLTKASFSPGYLFYGITVPSNQILLPLSLSVSRFLIFIAWLSTPLPFCSSLLLTIFYCHFCHWPILINCKDFIWTENET